MPRGRHPEGELPLSNAERQARYRARRQAQQPASVVRYRRPADRRTRVQRWHDTVARLVALQAEYAAWYDVWRTICVTPPPAPPCRPSSISISTISSASSRPAASAAIDRHERDCGLFVFSRC